jgi:hypothetical protein
MVVLSPPTGNTLGRSLDHNNLRKANRFLDSQSTLSALRNLNWLRYLAATNGSSSGAEVAELPSEYAPGFHYFFFCPEFMKEYYIAHELVHYFMDAYKEETTTELSKIIIRQQLAFFVLQY